MIYAEWLALLERWTIEMMSVSTSELERDYPLLTWFLEGVSSEEAFDRIYKAWLSEE